MHHFEDKLKEINEAIERKRWNLDALTYIDYDDIKQVIMNHIYQKWHKWDQSKPIEPWLNRVVSNQFKNLLRNYYGNYARPCLKCKFNTGGDGCNLTKDGTQNMSCPQFNTWAKKKKAAYDIKLALTMENHMHEVQLKKDDFFNYEVAASKLSEEIKHHLSSRHF